jgi:hypothetical protein
MSIVLSRSSRWASRQNWLCSDPNFLIDRFLTRSRISYSTNNHRFFVLIPLATSFVGSQMTVTLSRLMTEDWPVLDALDPKSIDDSLPLLEMVEEG